MTTRQAGVHQERVLIKTPATWEGIRATERLEREGIRCLVTLVCSRVQGRAAAEAGASVIATCESLRFSATAANQKQRADSSAWCFFFSASRARFFFPLFFRNHKVA